jgi:hypothetical protein
MRETTRTRRFLTWLRSGVDGRPWVTVTGPAWLVRILVAAGAKEKRDD